VGVRFISRPSIAKAQFHREFLFIFLEWQLVAMLAKHALMAALEEQVQNCDRDYEDDEVRCAFFYPGFELKRKSGDHREECEVFQYGQCQVRLFARLLACERQRGHIEKKGIREKQNHACGDEYLGRDGSSAEKFRGSDGSKDQAQAQSGNDCPKKNPDLCSS